MDAATKYIFINYFEVTTGIIPNPSKALKLVFLSYLSQCIITQGLYWAMTSGFEFLL